MKFFINLIVVFLLCNVSFAQQPALQWGEEYEDGGYYTMLGASEGAFFVEKKYDVNYNNRDVKLELFRFNDSLELTHAVRLEDLEKTSYESIATINSPEGLAHIYYQTTNRGEHIVSAQLFSHANLQKKVIVDLAIFQIIKNSQRMVRQDGDYQVSYPLEIITSDDGTKLAIMFSQEEAGRRDAYNYQYSVIDVANGFRIMHQGEFYSDYESKKYDFSDRHLSNSGKLTYALKRYTKDRSREHINRKPGYNYEIHHMSGDSLEYIYDIKVRDEFIDKLILGSDSEDNLYIAGYVRKQPYGDIEKTFFMGLDPLGYERFTVKEKLSRRDVKNITGREKDELDENYQTLAIIPSNDIIYVVRQYRRRGSRSTNINNFGFQRTRWGTANNFNNFENYWRYDDVVVDGVGKATGEILWTTVNKREQEDDDYYSRYFITGQMELYKNNLLLIYNEREENVIKHRRNEDLKRTDIPGDDTVITLARIDQNGDIEYQVLGEEDNYHVPENGALITDKNLYLFNQYKNYRKFVVGKTDLSILDF